MVNAKVTKFAKMMPYGPEGTDTCSAVVAASSNKYDKTPVPRM